MKPNDKRAKYFAEALGTFCLVFAGTCAIATNSWSQGSLGQLGVSLVFGLVVLAVIYSIGHISGAHINPAVTLGFYFAGRMEIKEVFPYVLAQLLGAIVGSFAVKWVFWGGNVDLGLTLPQLSLPSAILTEVILTAILMFIILGVATGNREQGVMAGVAIGATITLAALIGGPLSGASMNPARSFGPALIDMNFTSHWVYWVAPILGSFIGVKAYRMIQCPTDKTSAGPGCC